MVFVRGKGFPWREGMTVADVLKKLGDPYPYAVVRIGERLISRPDFEKTPVPDNRELFLIPMIAGG